MNQLYDGRTLMVEGREDMKRNDAKDTELVLAVKDATRRDAIENMMGFVCFCIEICTFYTK